MTLRQLPDLLDFLNALNEAKAKYLVVGGHAVGLHGHSRATKDLDVWIGEDADNRDAVIRALGAFGAPESAVRNPAASVNILELRRRICDGVENTHGLPSGRWSAHAA